MEFFSNTENQWYRFNPTWYGVLNYLVVWGGAESARREEWPLRLTEGSAEATNYDKYCS